MFNVDMTFEDTRIMATSEDGREYNVVVHDNFTGESKSVKLSSKQLGMVFAFNMDANGEPEGFEKMYEELEPIFAGFPNHLRPIP